MDELDRHLNARRLEIKAKAHEVNFLFELFLNFHKRNY